MSRTGVRIAGGRHRGRLIRVPPGVRPTSGRVREALFSIWLERLTGARVLDLFAGAGVIAFEALSRGAREVVCVDRSPVGLGIIAANAVTLDQAGLSTVRMELPQDLSAQDRRLDGNFELIFADPPYDFDDYDALLQVAEEKLLPDGRLAVEHSSRVTLPPEAGGLVRIRSNVYGESALSVYALRQDLE